MRKEAFESIKKELRYISLLFLIALVMFKIVFFKESAIVLLRAVASLFWLFVLPGYAIMLYWMEKLEFLERVAVGAAVSAAIIGISSYYLGLLGLNIRHHTALLPLAIIAVGFAIAVKKE